MNIERAFRFVFEDKEWITKLLIAIVMSVLTFLILPAFILLGYTIMILRRVMRVDSVPLPEWADYGKLLRDGFFVAVAQFIWTLPFLIVLFIGVGATIGFSSLTDVSEGLATAGAMGSFTLVFCLALLFGIALLFITPALYIQYAIKDDFGAMFRFGEIFEIVRNHLADILVVFLVTVAATFVISLITGILAVIPCLGWIAAFVIGVAFGPYLMFVSGHLYGQIARKVLGEDPATYLPKEPDMM
jgi:hypothetical protein